MLCALIVAGIIACGKSPVAPMQRIVSGVVLFDGEPESGVQVMVCLEGGKEFTLQTDGQGRFRSTYLLNSNVDGVVAVSHGKTGSVKVDLKTTDLRVDLKSLQAPNQLSTTRTLGEYWFGVYSTDGNGDVKFRYQFSFIKFTCVNPLPWIWWGGWQNPDPNSWVSWDLKGFPTPWKGKFLAVPTRLQWWHQAYYGYPIQKALYLISIG